MALARLFHRRQPDLLDELIDGPVHLWFWWFRRRPECRYSKLHGSQEGAFFHGYFRHYCYLPLVCFCGNVPLLAQLRDAKRDPAAPRWRRSRKSPAPFRTAFARDTHIVWADSGFAREEAALWVCLSPGSCPKSGRCRKRETRKSRRSQAPRDSRFLHTTLKRFNPDSAARVELASIWFGSLRHAFFRTDDGLAVPKVLGVCCICALTPRRTDAERNYVSNILPGGCRRKPRPKTASSTQRLPTKGTTCPCSSPKDCNRNSDRDL